MGIARVILGNPAVGVEACTTSFDVLGWPSGSVRCPLRRAADQQLQNTLSVPEQGQFGKGSIGPERAFAGRCKASAVIWSYIGFCKGK